jgi:hypothetical protein
VITILKVVAGVLAAVAAAVVGLPVALRAAEEKSHREESES